MTFAERPIRVAFADACILCRTTLCTYLRDLGFFEIEIEADNGRELIQFLKTTTTLPDICVLDISMPVKNGYETIKEVRSCWPSIKFLILTSINSEYSVFEMLRNGASGYLLKNCNREELKKALVSIYDIGNYQSETTISKIHDAFNRDGKYLLKINDKEIQFLSYCCSDYHYKEIAQKMGVSPRTVEGYRDDLFEKLKVKTRTGLAMYAMSIGISPQVQY
jgi:two-component system invasion response regulator UvrY